MKLMPSIEEVVLLVDFNDLEEDDSLQTYQDFSLGPFRPSEGGWARLIDGEGCSCLGYIRSIREGVVEVAPDWATWTTSTPAWATWTPLKKAVERIEDLKETLRWSREHPDEDLPLAEGPATYPIPQRISA